MAEDRKVKQTFGTIGFVKNCYFKHADCCGACGGKNKVYGTEGIIDERFGDDYENVLNAAIDDARNPIRKELPDEIESIDQALNRELGFELQLQKLVPEEIKDSGEIPIISYVGQQKGGRKFIKHMESRHARQTQLSY